MHKRGGKKLTGKNLNVDRQFFKELFLKKNCHIFAPFPITNNPYQMRILILFSYLFLSVDTNSQILKVDQIFWLGIIKNGYGQSGFGTLELTVSQE